LLAPGHPQLPLAGVPAGQIGTVILILLVSLALWSRSKPGPPLPWRRALVLGLLMAIKIGVWSLAPATGWLARYHANGTFAPPLARSLDFRSLDGTRIDRALSFEETEFPVHFFNDYAYNTGSFREWSEPFSVEWTGHVLVAEATSFPVRLEARGTGELRVDGARQSGSAIELSPGRHLLEVRYSKPENTFGLLRLSLPFAPITPAPVSEWQLMMLTPLAVLGWLLHVGAMAIVGSVIAPAVSARVRSIRASWAESPVAAAHALSGPLALGVLLTQGLWKSRHLVDHVWTLSGGDDWAMYEMTARDAVMNGLMISQGGVIGRGQPFSLYPGYSYFVALVHAVTGESLAGVILVNFLLLAVATLLAYRAARLIVGPVCAIGGLGWLLLIEQADFVRYYTVTLLSENLFLPLAAASVLGFTRYVRSGTWNALALGAIAGGLAAITRPSMMLFLPFAMMVAAGARWRKNGILQTAVRTVAIAALWLATLAPIALRNYWMSGQAVLITSGQAVSFVLYNMPTSDRSHFAGFDGSLFSAARILVRMFIAYPAESLRNYGVKAGFSLGMVHWMGSGTVHPELIVTSALFFIGLAWLPGMRSAAALPMLAFLFTHLATMILTMPSNYGYRMLLPMVLFTALIAGAVIVRLAEPVLRRRWPGLAAIEAGS